MRPRASGWARAAATAAAVAGVDQASKAAAVASLRPGESVDVFFGIDLTLVRNRGVAFGALAGTGGTVIAALTGVALVALVVYFALRADRPMLWLPVGMVLGGAAGNIVDRVRIGAVTDFIDPVLWPSFNVADAAIVLGVLGFLWVVEGFGEPAGDRDRAAAA
jgi:signal peptidase II